MQSSQYPQAAFELLKLLMDTEAAPFFGLSVNRENAANQLDYFAANAYHVRPGLKIPLEDGTLPDSSADYVIQPMSQKTRDGLMNIIDRMETVSLPNWPVYRILEEQMIRYARGEAGLEEAYQLAVSGLKAYIGRK